MDERGVGMGRMKLMGCGHRHAAGFSPPLDGVGTLSRAYSTWRLTTAYNGPLMKVSPVAGGAGTDFSATATGEIDWAGINTLTGGSATSHFCEIFYDQSGNGSNATAGGGTQVLVDPANKRLNTNGASSQNWLTFTGAALSQPLTWLMNFSVKAINSPGDGRPFSDTSGNIFWYADTNLIGVSAGLFPASIAKTNNSWGVIYNIFNGASSTIALNGSTTSQSDGTAGMGAEAFAIGTNPGSANFYRVDMYFDTAVIFSGNPGTTALNTFSSWLTVHAHI